MYILLIDVKINRAFSYDPDEKLHILSYRVTFLTEENISNFLKNEILC